ncbi:MAG: hypothetical protein J7M34_00940 [Anaerolineae bacterium]|nr:hypothetical protein [Anaerolineae bacterium]
MGHSKDQRPDLPQVKVKSATLDPLGMPLATVVVSGERADDPLYIPTIGRVRESPGRQGLLYIGDRKRAALATRACVQAGGDFYLCPLSQNQLPPEALDAYLGPVWDGQQGLTDIYRQKGDGEQERIAEDFERLVVRSLKQARKAEKALCDRLAKAQAALTALNKRGRGRKHFTEVEALRQAAEAIMAKYRVQGLLRLGYREIVHERPVRRYRDRPATVRIEREVQVTVEVDAAAAEEAVRRLGWRVYATNAPAEQLSLTQAVLAYRTHRSTGAYLGAIGLPADYLYDSLCEFFETALKMSEP